MINIQKGQFVDEFGRTLILRGVNLGGSSKVPYSPDGATYIREGFFDHHNVSFVGRPFPLEEADEHFARLRAWGFTFLRFLVTWEAVEHAGPGIYDQAYLDYLRAVLLKAHEYGISVFIDFHQDTWSRFSGGDGAPGWTFDAIGMDITRFQETGAAIVHATHGDPFPRMGWPTNAHKLAAATMFALFFAGNELTPLTRVEGQPVQEYLQSHFIGMAVQVARTLRDLPNVVGFDIFNEPTHGYIGIPDLEDCCGRPKLGDAPTPLQAMMLGEGIPQEVEVWQISLRGNHPAGRRRLVNSRGVRVWKDGYECVWKQNGVWKMGADGRPNLLRPRHFSEVNGRQVDFAQDYYRPFANRVAHALREEMPGALIFIESEPGSTPPRWGPEDAGRIVYGPHWYDVYTLILKEYFPWLGGDFRTGAPVFGGPAIRQYFKRQLGRYLKDAKEWLRGAPVLVGEIGIPFDLAGKKAFRSGDFSAQTAALDRTLRAVDDNLLSCTLWNYTPDNTNARGDLWNDEDLSIFSRDQQRDPADIHSGGRALRAAVRPYPLATAGEPLKLDYDHKRRRCEFVFRHAAHTTAPTELFVPNYPYPKGYRVSAPGLRVEADTLNQIVRFWPQTPGGTYSIQIRPA